MAKNMNLKEKSAEDLMKLLAEKREQLRTLRFGSVSRAVKDTSEPKRVRADIARVMTEIGVRKNAAA